MDKQDRDLLIKLSTKMDQLCKSAETNRNDNKEAHGEIIEKIDDNFKTTSKWTEDIHGRIDKQIESVHDRIDDQIKDCSSKSDKINETFLQSKVFYWVTGFVIAGLISAWGTISYLGKEMDTRVDNVEVKIEQYHPKPLDTH